MVDKPETWRTAAGDITHKTRLGREVTWSEAEAHAAVAQIAATLNPTPRLCGRGAVSFSYTRGGPVGSSVAPQPGGFGTFTATARDGTMWLREDKEGAQWVLMEPLPEADISVVLRY